MMVIGEITLKMAQEVIKELMVINIQVIGKMIKFVEKGFIK